MSNKIEYVSVDEREYLGAEIEFDDGDTEFGVNDEPVDVFELVPATYSFYCSRAVFATATDEETGQDYIKMAGLELGILDVIDVKEEHIENVPRSGVVMFTLRLTNQSSEELKRQINTLCANLLRDVDDPTGLQHTKTLFAQTKASKPQLKAILEALASGYGRDSERVIVATIRPVLAKDKQNIFVNWTRGPKGIDKDQIEAMEPAGGSAGGEEISETTF